MEDSEYPALFRGSDGASNERQRQHLAFVKAEYGLLLLAAIFSLDLFCGPAFFVLYALVFFALIVLLLARAHLKPVQHWYQSRALAESVKTLSWKYMMRAAPFQGKVGSHSSRVEFSEHLTQLLRTHSETVAQSVTKAAAGDQITREMDRVRALHWECRKEFYRENRIRQQREWYVERASENRRNAKRWLSAGVLIYVLACAMTLCRIWITDWNFWPIEPVIVLASSIVGWIQIKKFGELAAAYTVTAQEIGLLEPVLDEKVGDKDLADFVNEAELAFSREHTMWVARQSS